MSPKKKSAARVSAQPKDELIDALLQAEGDEGPLSLEERLNTVTRAAGNAKTRSGISLAKPPPPPPLENSDPVFSFDAETAAFDVESMRATKAAPSEPLQMEEPEFSPDVTKDFSLAGSVRAAEEKENRTQAVRMDSSAPYDFEQPARLKDTPPPPMVRREIRSSPFDALRVEPRPPGEKKTPPPPPIEAESESEMASAEAAAPEPIEISVRAVTKSVSQKLESALKRLRSEIVPEVSTSESSSPPIDLMAPAPAVAPDAAPTVPLPVSGKVPSAAIDDEKTMAMDAVKPAASVAANGPAWQDVKTEVLPPDTRSRTVDEDPEGERFMPTEIRAGSPGARFREEAKQIQPGAAIFSSAEAALRQSENLRVAQKRISDLERELERVRRENENLRSAGETLRRRLDELQAHAENSETNAQEARKIAEEEKKVLRGQIASRDREIAEMRGRLDDAEGRLEANFRKIRVRERDLEHRIEIIKAESQSIAASKDRMILELKRQVDQVTAELNHAKSQVQETFGQFKERQETARRAVRALRIALTVLEGEDDSGSRKAE
ncbi:MAG: hypothetical protein JNJ49_13835 [Bdellovibrionaceae bacterium]|nr:hypothetical protein [Pseudobdellovibrionaceae bacterium]